MEGTSSNATVKVYETGSTEETAARQNDYYFRDWDPNPNSTASVYPEINIKEGSTVSATKNAWIPGVSESPTYDANGNLTEDALWSYTYDEENRLIRMTETPAAAEAGFPDTEITFKYDYLGRRVEKKVVRGTVTETHLRFVWRGWLLVAELNAASDNSLVKTYTWGPDISGSFGGAGGNGGVLIFKDHTSTVDESFYPAYDAQGNVTGLIDTSGNLDAAYEYDPFGRLIRYAGARRTSMALLYGTKYTDMESGLIYYGHRYYDPRQGRFINRDPIGEEGGINLYGFAGNNPVNAVDFLGLCNSEGDVDQYGNEICSDDVYELPLFIVKDDLMAWGDLDDQTERAIEKWKREANSLSDLYSQSNVNTGGSSPGKNKAPPKKKIEEKKKEEKEEKKEWTEEECAELEEKIALYENEIMPMVMDAIKNTYEHVKEMTGGRILGYINYSNFAIGVGLTAVQSSNWMRRANNTMVTRYTQRGIPLHSYGTKLARRVRVAGTTVGMVGVGLELYNVWQADSALEATLSSANAGASAYGLYTGNTLVIGLTIAYNAIDMALKIFYLNPRLDRMAMDLLDQARDISESTVVSYDEMITDYEANCEDK